jgi:hypothetical protein
MSENKRPSRLVVEPPALLIGCGCMTFLGVVAIGVAIAVAMFVGLDKLEDIGRAI